MLDKRLAQAKSMFEDDFYGTKWWDYTPEFLTVTPDDAGVEEFEFDEALDSNGFILLS